MDSEANPRLARQGGPVPPLPSLRHLVREARRRRNWTLKQMSARSGIPLSTLSKVESGRMTLSYDRLAQLATRLGLNLSDFLANTAAPPAQIVARRSTQRWDRAMKSLAQSENLYPLCGELSRKRMDLALLHLSQPEHERFESEPGDGEAYYFVFDGCISVRTEVYQPEILRRGDSIYLDASMRHTFTLAASCKDAFVVRICCAAN
jgi:transcriptional regulator with XRE-family HTH domain